MAILEITTTSFAGNLKNYYTKFREDLFPLMTATFAQFQKIKAGGPRNMRWGGANGAIFDTIAGDPVTGHFSSAGYFGDATSRAEVQGQVGVARLYFRKQFDKLAQLGTSSKQGAYVTLAQKIDEELRTEFKLSVQEAVHGDGTGIKALVTNVVSTTVVDIQSPYGIASGGQGGLWVQPGKRLAVMDSSASFASLGSAVVSTVALQTAPDTYRVTFASAITGMSTGDALVSASASDTSYNSSTNGLVNLTNRGGAYGTLHTINAATYPRWNAVRMVAGTDTARTDQLLESDLVELMMRVDARSSNNAMQDSDEFVIITTPGLKKSYIESVQGQRQLTLQQTSKSLAGGYATDASCNGVAIIGDAYCPVGTVYLIHKPSVGWVDAKDLSAVAHDDENPWRWVDGRDAYETNTSIIWNICTTKRNAHGSITGYTDGNRYSPLAS